MEYYSLDRINLHCRNKKSSKPIDDLNNYSNHNLKLETKRKLFVPAYFHNLPEDKNPFSDSVYSNMMLINVHNTNPTDLFNNQELFNSFPINSRLHSNMEMDINRNTQLAINTNPILTNMYSSTRCTKDNLSTSNQMTTNRIIGALPN
jgi:hypothetical protein